MKILVVEDNVELNSTLSSALKNEGFQVFSAYDGASAKDHSMINHPDVILLDIMLPDAYGYDLIKYFRTNGDPFIMIVSALEEELTRLTAYEKGADDYLIKPIRLMDLSYKLKAIKKRARRRKSTFEIGDVEFDIDSLELKCQHSTLLIQRSQMTVFKVLYDRYQDNTHLDKNELIDFEGETDSVSFRLHTLIARLRKNLIAVGSEDIIIENIYGKGYAINVIK